MEKKLDMCEKTVIHKEIVETVKKQLPNDKKMESLALFYKMFSDPTKVKILCDLAVITNVTKSAISHQLSSLKEANLVKSRRDGKIIYYSLADSCVKEILEKAVIHTINE